MIYVRLSCGLGNQMFKYAFAFALARRRGEILAFDVSSFERTIFNKKRRKRPFELDQFCISQTDFRKKSLYLYFLRMCSKFLSLGNYYDGCFQDERLFADFADDIRKEFQFKEKLQAPEGNTVAVHIRRGDYVNQPNHLVCTPFYYENAVAYICDKVENPVFYVFSEDVEWCKENVKIPRPCFYVDSVGKPSSHDMQLMSLCKHNIISNSSYSWWAAWLNENPSKIVIAPDRWTGSKEKEALDIEKSIYTDNMVKISTR